MVYTIIMSAEQASKEEIHLERMYDGIRQEADGYKAYAANLLELLEEIEGIVAAKIPEQSMQINQVVRDIQELVEYVNVLAEDQIRASEDVRDICERQKVVNRIAQEYSECKFIYESNCELYDQSIQKNSDGNLIQIRKEKKQEALNDLKSKLAEYISATEKFNAFRDRRMSSAVMRYLQAASTFHTHENDIMKRVKATIVTLQQQKLELPSAVEEYLQEFNEFRATALSPIV